MKQAEQFALAAISAQARQLPGFQFDSPPHTDKGLIIFNAIWDGPKDGGSVEIGFYEVDPVTGTVWDGVMECKQIKTLELQKLQLRWRNQRGLSQTQIRKIGAIGPQCSTDRT